MAQPSASVEARARRIPDTLPPAHAIYPVSYAPETPSHPATAQLPLPLPRRIPVWRDITNSALLGDFHRDKRLAGAITQIVLSFLPLVGTICAVRDCAADLRYRDGIGFLLNVFALIPVFGGLPKTIEVIQSLWHMGHVIHATHHSSPPARTGRRVKPGLLLCSLLAVLLLTAGIIIMSGVPLPFVLDRVNSVLALFGAGLLLTAGVWVSGMVRAVRHGRIGWLLAILLLSPLTPLLYALVGPREPRRTR